MTSGLNCQSFLSPYFSCPKFFFFLFRILFLVVSHSHLLFIVVVLFVFSFYLFILLLYNHFLRPLNCRPGAHAPSPSSYVRQSLLAERCSSSEYHYIIIYHYISKNTKYKIDLKRKKKKGRSCKERLEPTPIAVIWYSS